MMTNIFRLQKYLKWLVFISILCNGIQCNGALSCQISAAVQFGVGSAILTVQFNYRPWDTDYNTIPRLIDILIYCNILMLLFILLMFTISNCIFSILYIFLFALFALSLVFIKKWLKNDQIWLKLIGCNHLFCSNILIA